MVEEIRTVAAVIAKEIHANQSQVEAAIQLLDEGATVPFIARYRKEATKGLDDTQLRTLSERLSYLRELNERRLLVIETIRQQDQLTEELEAAIRQADTKTRLEDLYLPYRPKRRTRAHIAKEAGLEPLALALWQDPSLSPIDTARAYINQELGIETAEQALNGAEQILMERFAEEANLLNELREYLWQHGVLTSVVAKDQKAQHSKYADYFSYAEPIHKIPSHRALALFRGRRESALKLTLTLENDEAVGEGHIENYFKFTNEQRAPGSWIKNIVRLTWKTKLFSKLELELLSRLRESADEEAIRVFASNLRDLLLAAPAGPQLTMGLDPGIRTGVKVVIVDITGKLLDYTTVFPFAPQNEWHPAIASLAKLAAKHGVSLISIGNGTGSRETERLVMDMIKMYPDLKLTKVVVSEAGASVYSASELAAKEFPELDVSLRGAVSIARRLQDPLAELVKIEPKAIGVGQYQHDVNQTRLAQCLTGVVEDCVNAVGVDVNTASVPLLMRVSGLNESLAKSIVEHRDGHGVFRNRLQLKEVARMGEKSFQQSAGFLKIMNGDNPLDASSVHPEAYPLVEKILADKKVTIDQVIGRREFVQSLSLTDYIDEQYGLPTLTDVLKELEKPGRDPRPVFKTATFKEGIEDITHLEVGMILEGVVSNVTNFGAFVDIGVHQDGLVHISAMTNRFVASVRSVVKAGDVITVKVVEVDKERRRIGLTMRLTEEQSAPPKKQAIVKSSSHIKPIKNPPAKKIVEEKRAPSLKKSPLFNTAMADALSKLKRGAE